ncbi:MAG: sigma-70 family RNA polymerase sigma factor, partial [Patescibacteria group bacterium]
KRRPQRYSAGRRVTKRLFNRSNMLEGEKEIVERAKGGEAEAFGALYDHYQPKIYRFVLLKTSHKETAEDLTHQAFLAAWQNIHKFSHRGFPFGSWLYQIAKNSVIDHYRAAKPTTPLENVAELISSSVNHEERADSRLKIQSVYEALKQLSGDHQDVIIMRFIEELSPGEIAKALGKTEGAVRVMQHRALSALKNTLKEKWKAK